jgi:hypothetical protein
MTVAEAMHGSSWVTQIRGAPSIPAIAEFCQKWDELRSVRLTETEDTATWKLTTSGVYSANSAYMAFFAERARALAAAELWKAGAPLMHKLHMWFAMKDHLWTADRLA